MYIYKDAQYVICRCQFRVGCVFWLKCRCMTKLPNLVEITELTDDSKQCVNLFIHIAQMAFDDSECQMFWFGQNGVASPLKFDGSNLFR